MPLVSYEGCNVVFEKLDDVRMDNRYDERFDGKHLFIHTNYIY